MNPENTSVLLIYTGGTIGMIENAETGALESFNFEQLQKHVPELQRFAFRIDTYQFDPPMDSSDMDPDAWRKLVRVIKGKVLDVAVDLRKSSPTFGKYVSVELSEENKRQFFIPRGFAHGFLVLSDEAVFTYKVDNVYAPQSEASIRFDDETIGIEWPVATEQLLLSDKDGHAVSFKDAVYYE